MKKNKVIAWVCFVLLGIIFLLPFVQATTGFIKEKTLNGYFTHVAKPRFTWEAWLNRSFQDSMELHLKDSIPLKASFVILRNQVDYSLFKKIYAQDVHIGKNNQFFRYTNYFAYGGNYPGDAVIEENVRRLKRIQDKLKAQQKQLIFVIAADKLWFYKEFLPDGVMNKKSSRFYDQYTHYMNKYKCDYIDFNAAFVKLKDTISATLFAQGGYHWSEYSGYLAMDSIANYLRLNEKFDVNKIEERKFIQDFNPVPADQDIYGACNLQFKLKEGKIFYHPKLTFGENVNKTKAILCGDSFCNAICFNNFYFPYFGEGSTYWYYNREIYDKDLQLIGNVGDNITRDLLEKSDIYIVLFSAGNLEKYEYEFLKHFEP